MDKGRLVPLIALAAVTFGMTGCTLYEPQGMWEVTTTEVDLEARNFEVRKLGAQGSATRTYLFGIPMGVAAVGIPLGPGNIQSRAMQELHQNWDGQGACVLHNINQEWTSYGIPGLLMFHQNTVTADIYEFNDEYVDYASRGERGL